MNKKRSEQSAELSLTRNVATVVEALGFDVFRVHAGRIDLVMHHRFDVLVSSQFGVCARYERRNGYISASEWTKDFVTFKSDLKRIAKIAQSRA